MVNFRIPAPRPRPRARYDRHIRPIAPSGRARERPPMQKAPAEILGEDAPAGA